MFEDKDSDELSPLHKAARDGNFLKVQTLVDSGSSVSEEDELGITTLHYAVLGGNFAVVDFLVRNGADVNAEDIEQNTPLHEAASLRRNPVADIAIMRLLVKHGANHTRVNDEGHTPYQEACEYGTEQAQKYLRQVEEGKIAELVKRDEQQQLSSSGPGYQSLKARCDAIIKNKKGEPKSAFHGVGR